MTYVLLQGPNDGYYISVQAASKKHFALVDNGWNEIDSGEYQDMLDKISFLEDQNKDEIIELYCHDNHSLIQTNEECLKIILSRDPNFLNNKDFL